MLRVSPPAKFWLSLGGQGTKILPLVEEAAWFTLGFGSAGEEEDGDEDEEAEAATGKRAAEDDEVGPGLGVAWGLRRYHPRGCRLESGVVSGPERQAPLS